MPWLRQKKPLFTKVLNSSKEKSNNRTETKGGHLDIKLILELIWLQEMGTEKLTLVSISDLITSESTI